MIFNKLKPGQVLSETQFYTVEKVKGNEVQLKTDSGEDVVVDKGYIEQCVNSAEQFSQSKKITRTEAAAMFLANSNIAMTVNFNKQVKELDIVKEITEAYQNSTPKEFETKVKKAIKKSLDGEERTMVGRHYGNQDEFGRVQFIDMNLPREKGKNYDTRMRLVDPRTINWFIVNGVKYTC